MGGSYVEQPLRRVETPHFGASRTGRHGTYQQPPGLCGSTFPAAAGAGKSLHDGLVGPLAQRGITSASTTILRGWFSAIDYCVAPPDPEGKALIAYSVAISTGPAYLVFGNATLGSDTSGAPLVHCHAVMRRQDGLVRGGHLIGPRCIVADEPISVLVTAFDGLTVRQQFDPETNILLFQPAEAFAHV
jgi:hypothetical protein